MKILSKGKIKKYKYTSECRICDTLFEFDESETKRDRDGDYIICPVCGTFIDIRRCHKTEIK